ncbi:YggT family protein [Nitriliruptoraceae bacterium ZYF776]|nr:YggT family protein [Profundirhabdus halotolerans]
MSVGFFCTLGTVATLVLLAHVIFSWVPRPPEPLQVVVLGVRRLVEPVLRPLRRVIPPVRLGGIAFDLSIILVFIGVRLLQSYVLCRIPF